MKKVIPILSIIVAAFCLAVSIIGIIAISISESVPQFGILAAPVVIVGFVTSALASVAAVLFFKSKLCRAAFAVDIVALAISVASLIVWLA